MTKDKPVKCYKRLIGGLGPLVVWDSNRGTPKIPNPFHLRGPNRNPNHQPGPQSPIIPGLVTS